MVHHLAINRPINSSSIRCIEWTGPRNPDFTAPLTVTFISGKSYTYQGVPYRKVRGLLRAHSAGRYFNRHIRTAGFVYQQVNR